MEVGDTKPNFLSNNFVIFQKPRQTGHMYTQLHMLHVSPQVFNQHVSAE